MKKLLLNIIFALTIPFSVLAENKYNVIEANIWKHKIEFGKQVNFSYKINYAALTAVVCAAGFLAYKLYTHDDEGMSNAFSRWLNSLPKPQQVQFFRWIDQNLAIPAPATVAGVVPSVTLAAPVQAGWLSWQGLKSETKSIFDSSSRFAKNWVWPFLKNVGNNFATQACVGQASIIFFPKLSKYSNKIGKHFKDWDLEWFIENQTTYEKTIEELYQELGLANAKVIERGNIPAQLLELHKLQVALLNQQTRSEEYCAAMLNKYSLLIRELEKIMAFMEYRKYQFSKNDNSESDIFSLSTAVIDTTNNLKNVVNNFAEQVTKATQYDNEFHSALLITIKKINLIVKDLRTLDIQIENS